MKPKLCRNREQGGLFLVIFVAVAVGALLIAGVWVVVKVISIVNRINDRDHADHAAIVWSVPQQEGMALVAATTIESPDIPAPPDNPVIKVLESTDLETWTESPLSAEEVLFNLQNRTSLTNRQCFYRMVFYE